jgi:hypothetical protein
MPTILQEQKFAETVSKNSFLIPVDEAERYMNSTDTLERCIDSDLCYDEHKYLIPSSMDESELLHEDKTPVDHKEELLFIKRNDLEMILNQVDEISDEIRSKIINAVCNCAERRILIGADEIEDQKLPLPKPGDVPLYRVRENKQETATEFFYRVYKPWLDAGIVIYQHQLRGKNGIDPDLMQGIRNQFKADKEKVAKIIKPKHDLIKKEAAQLNKKEISRLHAIAYKYT